MTGESCMAKVTVLVENTAQGRGLLGEHGLAFWIEIDGNRVLFDTGQTGILMNNARRLGIQLDRADAVVLSHGHYDHTGGLRDFLQMARAVTVYAHPLAFGPKYSRKGDSCHSVAMPNLDEQIVRDLAELVLIDKPLEIFPGLWLTGPVPRVTDFEDTGGAFFKDEAGVVIDDLIDDQAAFIASPAGTTVILGCAHSGVINTLLHVRHLTGGAPIHTVMGGMHLVNASQTRLDRTIEELRGLNVQRLLPCHCTGSAATAELWREFPGKCSRCNVGDILKAP